METKWWNPTDFKTPRTEEFRVSRKGKRDITGAVWRPSAAAVNALVCIGHGASGDRYQAPIPYLAEKFSEEHGISVLALDGPVHGLRQVGSGGREAFISEAKRPEMLDDMLDDWHCSIEQVVQHLGLDKPKIAYFGLSMGTLFGVPFVSQRTDVVGAVFGLSGLNEERSNVERIRSAARVVECPILFLMQLEDELVSRENYLKLFDEFAASDRSLHANKGLHPEVPQDEVEFSYEFLVECLLGHRTRRIINIIAD